MHSNRLAFIGLHTHTPQYSLCLAICAIPKMQLLHTTKASAARAGCLNCTGSLIASMTSAAAGPAWEKGTAPTSDAHPIEEGSF